MMKAFSKLMYIGVVGVPAAMGISMGCAAVGVSDGACLREDGQVIGGLTAICIGYYLYLISAKVGLKPAQSTWAEMLGLALLCFVSFFLGSMYEHISLPSMTAKVALLAAAALWVRMQWKAHFGKSPFH